MSSVGNNMFNAHLQADTNSNGFHLNGRTFPEDVGIVNMEIYFPSKYVDQSELETFDGASSGKYTIGLGQTRMGFCGDNEDVNSLCLTALSRLVRKSGISYKDIGRLEVGTETIIDKSKSVKSVLMQLFESSGNTDVEGVDSTNACYGGTAALFNCVSWVESSYWDGRFAVAVCGDIAVYAKGNARPTGGAGAVAMLIGPNAALVLDRGLRANHVQHAYDFYKPKLDSEYPEVDGALSIQCYLSALDRCYQLYCTKAAKLAKQHGNPGDTNITLDSFDAILFHTPFCKLVQKSLARLSLNDFVRVPKEDRVAKFGEALEAFVDVELEKSYSDKTLEKAFMTHSQSLFEAKTKPSLLVATNVGNMYTPSLYGGLVSYISSTPLESLANTRLALFSYGSGLVSSFYTIRVTSDASPMSPLGQLKRSLGDVKARLDSRTKVAPEEFDRVMSLREAGLAKRPPFNPTTGTDDLFPGTWYLRHVDEKFRRTYGQVDAHANGH